MESLPAINLPPLSKSAFTYFPFSALLRPYSYRLFCRFGISPMFLRFRFLEQVDFLHLILHIHICYLHLLLNLLFRHHYLSDKMFPMNRRNCLCLLLLDHFHHFLLQHIFHLQQICAVFSIWQFDCVI